MKLAIDGLHSISVAYDLNCNDVDLGANSVDVYFKSKQKANTFITSLQEMVSDKASSPPFQVHTPFSTSKGDETLYKVKLTLGFGVTNKGVRADATLTVLKDYFELPPTIDVEWDTPTNDANPSVVKLPIDETDKLKLVLRHFLKDYDIRPAINGLHSISVAYDLSCINGRDIGTESVDVYFKNEPNARAFRQTLLVLFKEAPGTQQFQVNFPYSSVKGEKELYKVQLSLGFGMTNKGVRADSTLTVLKEHFELPPTVDVEWRKKLFDANPFVVVLPTDETDKLKLTLNQFLNAAIAEQIFNISCYKCEVAIDNTQPNQAVILCENKDAAEIVKQRIFTVASEVGLQTNFSMEQIRAAVPGEVIEDRFILKSKAKLDILSSLQQVLALNDEKDNEYSLAQPNVKQP